MFIGNSSIRAYFENLIKSDNLSHAYLFHGPEGVGKKSFVLRISELIAGPVSANPDMRIIDKGDEEIHIADIRDLKNFIHLTPFGKYKIAVINNAHKLGHDASDALLKILEEPPGKSVLFLISHLPKMLLPTVSSRCQTWRFRPLKQGEVSDYLINEKKVKKEIAEFSARLSNGSLGLAVKLAGDFEHFQKNVCLLGKFIKAGFKERFETAKKISENSEDLKRIAGDWFIYSAARPEKKLAPHLHASEGLARKLLHLNSILSKSQFNHRLALDNFLADL